jgi:hypothetical protein
MASSARLRSALRRPELMLGVLLSAWVVELSAHVIKTLDFADTVTAFVSSPSAGSDAPVRIAWSTTDTGLRVVCFNVANTSTPNAPNAPWPRITSVGFELPGAPTGFSLLAPLDGNWQLVEGVRSTLEPTTEVTLDFAIVAGVNPTGRTPGRPADPRGIPPGQPAVRGAGTQFCVSGPFPDRLPDLSTSDPTNTVATTIELLINGVVVGFSGVEGRHQGSDTGVWFPPPGTNPRQIPLYP